MGAGLPCSVWEARSAWGKLNLGEAVAFALFGDGGQRECMDVIRRAIPPVRPSLTKVA